MGAGWASQIYPYVKSTQIFTCPSDTTTANTGKTVVSYAYNPNLSPTAGTNGQQNFLPMGSIAKLNAPTLTLMLDEVEGCNNANPADPADQGSPQSWGMKVQYDYTTNFSKWATGPMNEGADNVSSNAPKGRHLETSNYLFCDGHVKSLKGDRISPGSVARDPSYGSSLGGNYTAAGTSYVQSNGLSATYSPN